MVGAEQRGSHEANLLSLPATASHPKSTAARQERASGEVNEHPIRRARHRAGQRVDLVTLFFSFVTLLLGFVTLIFKLTVLLFKLTVLLFDLGGRVDLGGRRAGPG